MIVFTCGGSGGHVYPAIAVAQELDRSDILFIGSKDREDAHIVPKYGFKFSAISSSSKNIFKILKGFFQSLFLLKKAKVVIGSGGYLTASVILAAFFLRIPIILIEQNAKPGRVNRYLQWFATHIFLSFSPSLSYFNSKKSEIVGNPVRKTFLRDALTETFLALTLPPFPVWLVFGGSQGSDAINQLFFENKDYFLKQPLILIHLTGHRFFGQHANENIRISKDEKDQIKIIQMPYFESMDILYAKASLIIARSGATTVAELLYFSKPSILIPYPLAKDNHQVDNAQIIVEHGHGVMLPQAHIDFYQICDWGMRLESQSFQRIVSKAREKIADYVAHY